MRKLLTLCCATTLVMGAGGITAQAMSLAVAPGTLLAVLRPDESWLHLWAWLPPGAARALLLAQRDGPSSAGLRLPLPSPLSPWPERPRMLA